MLKETIRSLFKHSAVYSLAWIGSSAASILLLPVYTRYLSKAEYGILEVLAYSNEVLSLIMLAGFNYGLAKFYQEGHDEEARQRVISTGILSVAVIGLFGCPILFAFREILANIILGNEGYAAYIGLDVGILFGEMIFAIGNTYLVVAKKSKAFAIYSFARLIVGICVNLYFVVVLRLGVVGMLYGQLTSNVISGVIVAGHALYRNGIKYDVGLARRVFAFSLPIVPAWISAGVMHNADRLLIRRYCSLDDVGVYSLGYKFPFMLNALLLASFTRIWTGATMYEVAKDPDAEHQYAKITTYFMSVFVFAQYALSMFAPSVVRILAHEKFYEAHGIVPIIALGISFHAFYAFFTIGAYVKGKTWLLNLSYFPAAVINVLFNVVLLPKFGYMAAAWVSVFTYLCFSVMAYLSCRSTLRIPFETRRLGLLFGWAVVLYVVSSRIQSFWLFPEFLKSSVFVVLFVLALVSSGWLSKGEKEFLQGRILWLRGFCMSR